MTGLWFSEAGKSKRHVMPEAFAMDDVDISDTTTCKEVAALLSFSSLVKILLNMLYDILVESCQYMHPLPLPSFFFPGEL